MKTDVSSIVSDIKHIAIRTFSCSKFVKYEGAFTTVSVALSDIMMILRVNALYGGNRGVMTLICGLFLAQIGVQAWLLSGAQGECFPEH